MRTLLILALAATPLAAQQPETLPLVARLPGSTRALGMGGAYPIGATDSDAIFYNPAMSDRLRGASLGVQWAGSASTLYTLSAATDWWGGAIGVGVMGVDYHAPLAGDAVLLPAAPADLLVRGQRTASERSALLTYGRRIKKLRVAATGRLLEQRADAERNITAALDLATAVTVSWVTVGLTAQNLGPGIEVRGQDTDLPLRTALNASTFTAQLGPVDPAAAAEVSWTRHGDVIPAGGLELSWWPVAGRTFFARAGARRTLDGEKPFTLGAGFAGDKLMLDYAFVPYEDGSVHRVGVRWR